MSGAMQYALHCSRILANASDTSIVGYWYMEEMVRLASMGWQCLRATRASVLTLQDLSLKPSE